MCFGQFINLFKTYLLNPYYMPKVILALCNIEEYRLDDGNCG